MKKKKDGFEKGDKIIYQYTHHLNSRSSTQIIKDGIFIRRVKSKSHGGYDWNINQKCVIQVDGNVCDSTVMLSEIKHRK